jgi:hypothetical protein
VSTKGAAPTAGFASSRSSRAAASPSKGRPTPTWSSIGSTPVGEHTHLTFIFELAQLNLALRPFEKLIRIAAQDGAERVIRNLKGLIESSWSAPPEASACAQPPLGPRLTRRAAAAVQLPDLG